MRDFYLHQGKGNFVLYTPALPMHPACVPGQSAFGKFIKTT
ncbi:hypothetical protein [Mucilaginibacter sp. PAMB04168]